MKDIPKRRTRIRAAAHWTAAAIVAFLAGRASQEMQFDLSPARHMRLPSVSPIQQATMANYRRRIEQLELEKQALASLAQKLRARDSATLDDWLQRESAVVSRVTDVTDEGETIVVTTGEKEHRIRLDGIDCPDGSQPLASRSLSFVTDLCFGREVELVGKGRDGHGGMQADVLVNGVNVGRELLRAGLARRSRTDSDPEHDRLEEEARQDGRGLWADENIAWRESDR